MSDELQHYGVKGMKWGVRRYQPYPKGSGKVGKFVDRAKQRRDVKKQEKTDKKHIKKASDPSAIAEVYNAAAQEMNNGGIDKFNKKWNDKKVDHLNDPKIREEYYKDYEKEFQKVANKHAKAATTESPTGNIRTEYKYQQGSILPTAIHVVTEKGKDVIQQSDNDNVIEYRITHDSKGFIKTMTRDSERLKHYSYIESGEEFLQHYGVKGMKWGVRRYQPYPKGQRNAGKFIDAGKSKGSSNQNGNKNGRMRSSAKSKGREISMALAQREIKNLSTKDAKKVISRAQLENRYKQLSRTPNVGSAKAKSDYRNRANMSDQELRRKVDRLQVSANMRTEARKANPEIIEIGKKAATMAAPFVVAQVFKKVNGSEFSAEVLKDIGKQAGENAAKWVM